MPVPVLSVTFTSKSPAQKLSSFLRVLMRGTPLWMEVVSVTAQLTAALNLYQLFPIFAFMKRYFNTTGFCNPMDHYMVNPFRDIYGEILRLVEAKQYFLIHAPRQTGKTTFLHSLAHRLNQDGKYISVVGSLEAAGYSSITVADANWVMVKSLYQNAKLFLAEDYAPRNPERYSKDASLFQTYLMDWCEELPKPVVLLLDEVDALYDDVLISVLRQLRDGFQRRPKLFPQSIALVGLRDIREYKMRARADNPSIGAGSPFNVKAKSFFLPVFSLDEVRGLLQQHTDDTGQVFSEEVLHKAVQVLRRATLADQCAGKPNSC
jgi:hypothetical protein